MEAGSRLELERDALRIRLGMVQAISANGGGHIGGSFDLAEMLAVIYDCFLRVDPKNPSWEDRDYMILSKGHTGVALYATLALKGYFPYERLNELNKPSSLLPGHCDRLKVPGVDATTGSLGQGLSIACGVALGAKIRNSGQRVYCVIGDGETSEGQIWEAALFAAHNKLDDLIVFMDWNKMQVDGPVEKVMSLGDPAAKFSAFGWRTFKVNGADVLDIEETVEKAVSDPDGRPVLIVLDTVKGQGAECITKLKNNHCIGFPPALREQVMDELRERGRELGMEVQ